MSPARQALGLAAALAAAAFLTASCSKKEAPAVDPATERAEANKRAREDVFGTQVKAHDDAQKMGDDLNKKAQDNLDKADAMSK